MLLRPDHSNTAFGPRLLGRTQTFLIATGLMLSTTMIAALGTGQTIAASATVATYGTLDKAAELVVSSVAAEGTRSITTVTSDRLLDEGIVYQIVSNIRTLPLIDSVMPVLVEIVPGVRLDGGP